jgi:DNA-binding beta-propeller fold protein YncE
MSAGLPAPAILPLWDDFDDTSGNVYYEVRGIAPNREFIIEWFQRARFDGAVNANGPTFEVILGEDGTLRFEYADVSYYTAWNNRTGDSTECWSGACATIGLFDSPLLFDQFSSYWFAVDDGAGIQWTSADLSIFTANDSVTVNVGAPQIVINPDTIDATVQAGSMGTISLTVENHGTRVLDWMLDEAPPANFHFPIGPRYAPLTIAPDETDVASSKPSQAELKLMHGRAVVSDSPFLTTTATPAFGCVVVSETSCDYVSFDAAAPGTLDTIAPENELVFGASFVGDDFSKEYVIADATGNLKTIDTATGAITDVGPTGFGSQMRSIAYDARTDTLFGTAIDGHGTDVFTIDRNTGTASAVHPITGLGSPAYVMGLAVEPYTGLMYGIEIATSALVAIDKTTGAASVIGPLGHTTRYSQGLAFDAATGELYLSSIAIDAVNHAYSQNMYTIDIYTGHANFIGPIGNDIIELGAFGIVQPAGPCSHPSDQPWLSLSPSSDTTIPAGSTTVVASIDATGASAGDVLSGTLCAASNDPAHRMVATPITATVTP